MKEPLIPGERSRVRGVGVEDSKVPRARDEPEGATPIARIVINTVRRRRVGRSCPKRLGACIRRTGSEQGEEQRTRERRRESQTSNHGVALGVG